MGIVRTIDFHGDQLLGFEDDRGIYIALRPMVTAMGLNWSGQYSRLRRDPILGAAVCMMQTPAEGGGQETVCIPLDLVPGFLFGVDANRVDATIRDKVLDYQRSCFTVLARAFLRPSAAPRSGAGPIADVPTSEGRKLVAEARSTFGVMAARELWFAVGLPRTPSMYEPVRQLELFRGEYRRASAGGQA